jgi:hypothetical protein
METEYIGLTKMKFLVPAEGKEHVCKALDKLLDDIQLKYQELETES